jgi:hypothetical protein
VVVAAALQERGGPHALVGDHGVLEMGDRLVPVAHGRGQEPEVVGGVLAYVVTGLVFAALFLASFVASRRANHR